MILSRGRLAREGEERVIKVVSAECSRSSTPDEEASLVHFAATSLLNASLVKCLFFQVQARPQKEVSLLDLDDCKFQLKHLLENQAPLLTLVALTRCVFYSTKLGFKIIEDLEPEHQLYEILISSLISVHYCI